MQSSRPMKQTACDFRALEEEHPANRMPISYYEEAQRVWQVVRHKARLVVKGLKQKFGCDFFETYSSVANVNSIRVVLSVVVANGYQIEHLDPDTSFLKSDLKEEVYMELPKELSIFKHDVQARQGLLWSN